MSGALQRTIETGTLPQDLLVQILRTGKPTSADSIIRVLGRYVDNAESQMPAYIKEIKAEGGQVRIYKANGKIVGYQLLNHKMFNKFGIPTTKARKEGIEASPIQEVVYRNS